jgi:hypothetical protein
MSETVTARDEKAEWLERVLGIKVPKSGTAQGPTAEEVRERVNTIGLTLKNKTDIAGHADLAKQFSAAVALMRSGDLAGADALLDEVQKALDAVKSQPSDAPKGPGVSLRGVAMVSLNWRKVVAEAQQQIPALKAAVIAYLQSDDEFGPDDIDSAREELERLDEITDQISEDLSDMVDDLINATPEQRPAEIDKLLKAVDAQEQKINANELVQVISDNGVMAIDIAGPTLSTLAALRTELASVQKVAA